MFSDQKCIGAGIEEEVDIGLAVNAALDDEQPIIRNQLRPGEAMFGDRHRMFSSRDC